MENERENNKKLYVKNKKQQRENILWEIVQEIKCSGKIYAHPSHAETVLVIDTTKEGDISELKIHRAAYDKDKRRNYKWLGGTRGADGNIYCPACDASSILKINVLTDHCETLGFAGTDKNKFQGQYMYCIIMLCGQIILSYANNTNLKYFLVQILFL